MLFILYRLQNLNYKIVKEIVHKIPDDVWLSKLDEFRISGLSYSLMCLNETYPEKAQSLIVKLDIQGAATIKKILPDSVSVFLMPSSFEELAKRLKQRHSESTEELNLRLNKARDEMKRLSLFDYVIVNRKNRLDLVISQINAIVTAEKCRVEPRIVKLRD